MGVIKTFVQVKENENLEIATETERLYLKGLCYREALRKAKEIYMKREKVRYSNKVLFREGK